MKAIPLRISAATARKILLTAMLTFLSALAVFAQTQSNAADLTGTVTDPNGAVVAGATVTATSPATEKRSPGK